MKVIIGVEQPPRVQFTIEVDENELLPDAITLPDGSMVILAGKYASEGERWCYRRIMRAATVTHVSPWEENSGLTGG